MRIRKSQNKMIRFAFVFILMLITLTLGAPGKTSTNDVNGRIVGGETVDISDYPYTLALLENNKLICAAALISEEVALTAAQCVVEGNYEIEDLTLRGGSTTWHSGGQEVHLSKVVPHHRYNFRRGVDWDIAALFLASKFTHPNVKIIPLVYMNSRPQPEQITTVAGWGKLQFGGPDSDELQMIQIPVVEEGVCHGVYGPMLSNNMWCAGYPEGGKDVCTNDYGGPAVIDGELAGLVSFSFGCAREDTPGVYSGIAAYRLWIYEVADI